MNNDALYDHAARAAKEVVEMYQHPDPFIWYNGLLDIVLRAVTLATSEQRHLLLKPGRN